jgi:hypothetical protein
VISVPAGVDSVSVLFWTRYLGNAFDPTLHSEVRVSTDSGATWTLAGVLEGNAPTYYPERVDVVGVAGRSLLVEFDAGFSAATQTWWLDEIAVVAHGATQVAQRPRVLLPSANPVRGDAVRFAWPFTAEGGDLRVYDFAGRLVWRTTVTSGVETVSWPIAERGVRNGVYLVVAHAGSERVRLKLFVVRGRA